MFSPDQHFIVQGRGEQTSTRNTLQHCELPGLFRTAEPQLAAPRRNPGVASARGREPASPSAGSSKHDLSEKQSHVNSY